MTNHIRIPDVSPVVQAMADGAKSVFSFPFPIFQASDLEVRSNSTLISSGYTVVGEGSSTGGAVVFTNAPTAGARITLRRKQTYARTDDFLDERAPTPHELNDAVDQNVAALQELAEQVSRAVTRPLSADLSAPVDLSLPNPEAGKVLGWNNLGNSLVNLDTQADIPVGKVQVDANDAPGFLDAKLEAGSHITLTKNTGSITIAVNGLASVATSGNYADLTGKPNLATVATSGNYADLTGKPNLATVATSGNYTDLSNRPVLGSAAYENIGTSGANVPLLSTANTYGAPQTPSSQTLTDADTVDIAITAQVWTLTTTAARTIAAPTGGVANTFYFLKIVTNGFTPIWNTAFDFGAAQVPANLTGTCGFDIFYDGSKYRVSTRFTGGV